MRASRFEELRDIVQGNFAIESGCLFYKEKKIAAEGKIVLASSEEAFFQFDVEDEETRREFEKVIFLHFWQSRFFKCKTVLARGNHLQFETAEGIRHAYCLAGYSSTNATKAIGSHFEDV